MMLLLARHTGRTLRILPCRLSRALSERAGPALLSKTYLPTAREASQSKKNADTLRSAQLLQQAGFIRQSSTGIFSFLPFGQRVIEKIEAIVQEEMTVLGIAQSRFLTVLPDISAWCQAQEKSRCQISSLQPFGSNLGAGILLVRRYGASPLQ